MKQVIIITEVKVTTKHFNFYFTMSVFKPLVAFLFIVNKFSVFLLVHILINTLNIKPGKILINLSGGDVVACHLNPFAESRM